MPQIPDGAASGAPSGAGPAAPSDVLIVLRPTEGAARPHARAGALQSLLQLLFGAIAVFGVTGALPWDGPSGWRWFALYAAGFLGGIWLPTLMLRLMAGPLGLEPVRVTVGAGHWGWSTVRRGRLVVFRQVLLVPPIWQLVVTERAVPPGRLRAAMAAALLVPTACAAGLVSGGGSAAVAGFGCAYAVVMYVAVGVARRQSVASLLFRSSPGALDELRTGPAEMAAARALNAGRLAAARDALAEPCPQARPNRSLAEATLALAEGRVEEAARAALLVHRRSTLDEGRGAAVRIYAQALAEGIAAGRWTAEEAGPAFDAAVSVLAALAPLRLRASELPAVRAVLRGRTHDAVAAATKAAALAPEALSRARALAVLTEVLVATGDVDEARRALVKAERLVPGMSRTDLAAAAVPSP